MTPTEAAALALLGVHDRRLLAALIRSVADKSTAEDHEALPSRVPGEPLLDWACRCRGFAETGRRTETGTGPGTGLTPVPGMPGVPDIRGVSSISAPKWLEAAAMAQLTRGAQIGAAAVVLFGQEYPSMLASIVDPPPLLWVRGEVASLHAPAIAIVGSRAATPHGIAVAATLAADLASAGLVIVSGLARGVDCSAHAAALSAGGDTIGVLGCGIDRIYPAEHRDLACNMASSGAVVSEYPPGVPPLPHHFPQRNRIISGLAAAVVVVEAPERSGALITAHAALEQGRDVMAVPGSTLGGRNRGAHQLIRDGAKIVESADDILSELGPVLCQGRRTAPSEASSALPQALDFTVDEVAQHTGERPNVVLARLLDLELAGQIQRIGGGRFIKVHAERRGPAR